MFWVIWLERSHITNSIQFTFVSISFQNWFIILGAFTFHYSCKNYLIDWHFDNYCLHEKFQCSKFQILIISIMWYTPSPCIICRWRIVFFVAENFIHVDTLATNSKDFSFLLYLLIIEMDLISIKCQNE